MVYRQCEASTGLTTKMDSQTESVAWMGIKQIQVEMKAMKTVNPLRGRT
jgi:hypothetical protein